MPASGGDFSDTFRFSVIPASGGNFSDTFRFSVIPASGEAISYPPLEGAVPKGPGEDAPTETDFPLHNIHFPLQHYTKLFHHTVPYLLA